MKAVRVCGGDFMEDIALPRKLPSLPPVARQSPSAIGVTSSNIYEYLQTSSKRREIRNIALLYLVNFLLAAEDF